MQQLRRSHDLQTDGRDYAGNVAAVADKSDADAYVDFLIDGIHHHIVQTQVQFYFWILTQQRSKQRYQDAMAD
ncbi:hypothetical protein D3C75_1142810 [compost metagenome]